MADSKVGSTPEEFGDRIMGLMMGQDMTREEAGELYRQVLLNEQSEILQGAFLAIHFAKPAKYPEVAGLWDALMKHVVIELKPRIDGPILDMCGSGADPLKTVNASTGASIIAAGAGAVVGKTGAQRITGKAGTADVFAAFGVDIVAPPERAVQALEGCGFCFLFSPMYFKPGIGRILQQIRFASCLNVAGPLTTPWNGWHQVAGAFAPPICDVVVGLMQEVGFKAGASPYGMCDDRDPALGMDEVSVCGPTRIMMLENGEISERVIVPEEIGLKRHPFEAIATSESGEENAQRILRVLGGKDTGALHDFLCANAGLALLVMDLAPSLEQATTMAKQAVADGAALAKLLDMLEYQAKDPAKARQNIERSIGA